MKIEFYVYCRKYYEIEIYFENIGAIGINCIERRVSLSGLERKVFMLKLKCLTMLGLVWGLEVSEDIIHICSPPTPPEVCPVHNSPPS